MVFKFEILLFVAVAVVLQGTTSSARRDCPTIKAMANFNSNAFSGRWYEIKRTKTMVDALKGTCSSVNFTINSQNNVTLSMSTKVLGRMVNTRSPIVISPTGVFDWVFNVGPLKFEFEYHVISTDNTNYAVTYACGDVPVIGATEMVWIYSRTSTLDQKFIDQALADLKANNVDVKSLSDVDQKNCDVKQ